MTLMLLLLFSSCHFLCNRPLRTSRTCLQLINRSITDLSCHTVEHFFVQKLSTFSAESVLSNFAIVLALHLLSQAFACEEVGDTREQIPFSCCSSTMHSPKSIHRVRFSTNLTQTLPSCISRSVLWTISTHIAEKDFRVRASRDKLSHLFRATPALSTSGQ